MTIQEIDIQLLFDGARGIYIPKEFTEIKNICMLNVKDETISKEDHESNEVWLYARLDDLRDGVESEYYWDSWNEILDNVGVYKEINNGMDIEIYMLKLDSDGNLWAICQDEYNELSETDKEEFWEYNF